MNEFNIVLPSGLVIVVKAWLMVIDCRRLVFKDEDNELVAVFEYGQWLFVAKTGVSDPLDWSKRSTTEEIHVL